ncbi:hypothetical protein LR48_Vigan11g062700 [Vigna angularis]|uniref:Putative plant transposon protein domain-containing protein n=1 Tax=Phaseolus angularis TaxID=3914 RepID=A0A0L9VS74_PHAAN|nr:hypothetical protein LR48_Vigan11g062700 [Vigna angularis]
MSSSSGKRIKTLGTKDKGTKRKEKEQFYSNKFRTPAHERCFQAVEGRRLLMERKVANIPSLAPQFERELNNREWGHLEIYPSPTNIDIDKEFYTNAKALGGEDETYISYEGEQCQFATSMLEGVDYEDVEQTLCVPGGKFHRNKFGAPIHLIRPHLTPLANYWMTFSHANHWSIQERSWTQLILHTTMQWRSQAIQSHHQSSPGHTGKRHHQLRSRFMRGEQELLRTLTSAFLKRQFISQDDFAAGVAWPADPA